jgi:hypothetical protein
MKRREFLQSAGVIGAATLCGLPEAAWGTTVARHLPEGVMIFGTGGAGGRIVQSLIEDGFDPAHFAVMDADTGDLAASRAGLRVLTGSIGPDRSWITTEEQVIAAENALFPLLKASRRSVLVAGLGGRMGRAYAHTIACLSQQAARELGRNVELHLVVAMPFAWEPQYRKAWRPTRFSGCNRPACHCTSSEGRKASTARASPKHSWRCSGC